MTKQDFLYSLDEYLRNELPPSEITEIIHYYDKYIRDAVINGQVEEQIIEFLGDPSLIAKSIIESKRVSSSDSYASSYKDAYENLKSNSSNHDDHYNKQPYHGNHDDYYNDPILNSGKTFQISKFRLILTGLAILATVILVFILLFKIFIVSLPIIIIIILITMGYSSIRNMFHK